MSDKNNKNIITLAFEADNARMWSPNQAIEDALEAVKTENEEPFSTANKILIIALDDTNGDYNYGFRNAGMSASEAAGLCKIASDHFSAMVRKR